MKLQGSCYDSYSDFPSELIPKLQPTDNSAPSFLT